MLPRRGCRLPASASGAEIVPGELVVRFDPGVNKAESKRIAGDLDAKIEERLPIMPGLAVIDNTGQGVGQPSDCASSSTPTRVSRWARAQP
ncbi:hypothetical protein BH20ACT15_BH20ACT15_14660 [soil metagenome]